MITVLDRANDILDYERLVADYNASLFATLRHHRSAGALDIWVPDDDPLKSVVNMVDAAELAAVPEIHIRIGPKTLENLDLEALRALAGEVGEVSTERDGESVVFSVRRIGGREGAAAADAGSGDWFDQVGPIYRHAIRAAAGQILHEGELSVPHGCTRFAAERDGITLALAVDSAHRITAAAHEGTRLRQDRSVMDVLCTLLAGLTMQEASDHAVLRVERALRADGERPVPGIVLPQNAEPVFIRPALLMRDVAAAYAVATGYAPGRNTFTLRASSIWLELSREAKLERLQAVLDGGASGAGLKPGDVRVADIEHHLKVTIAFHETVDVARKPKALMDLERIVRREIEPSIQLYSIELKDGNKLRRL